MKKIKIYMIEYRTGCSCCKNENHYRGPFSSRQIAEERITHYQETKLLASQYAEQGVYYIEEYDAEQLPDGRIIFGNYVAQIADGTTSGDDEERFYSMKSY